jgi:hypothetical protein
MMIKLSVRFDLSLTQKQVSGLIGLGLLVLRLIGLL